MMFNLPTRDFKIILTGPRYSFVYLLSYFSFIKIRSVSSRPIIQLISLADIIRQDGADNGYGAKAQEILGQVRGRYVFRFFLEIPLWIFGIVSFAKVPCT